MPLGLTPLYLALLGATVLFLGMGEDSPAWTAAGAGLLLAASGAILAGALRRRWVRRLRSDAHPIRAEVTGVVTAPIKVWGRTPHRLVCRGLTAPAVGRTFRSGWILPSSTASLASLVMVLIDPRRTSRYLVDVPAVEPARSPLRSALRHLGALALVLGVACVELVAIGVARPEAPLGPVHGDVQANGAASERAACPCARTSAARPPTRA